MLLAVTALLAAGLAPAPTPPSASAPAETPLPLRNFQEEGATGPFLHQSGVVLPASIGRLRRVSLRFYAADNVSAGYLLGDGDDAPVVTFYVYPRNGTPTLEVDAVEAAIRQRGGENTSAFMLDEAGPKAVGRTWTIGSDRTGIVVAHRDGWAYKARFTAQSEAGWRALTPLLGTLPWKRTR